MTVMSLRRPQMNDAAASSTRRQNNDASLYQTTRTPKLSADNNTSAAFKRSSIVSATSSGRRSSGSADSTGKFSRPSALPRSTSSGSQARLSYIASSRPAPSYAGRSPPLQALTTAKLNAFPAQPRVDTSRLHPSHAANPPSAFVMSPVDIEDDLIQGALLPEKRVLHDKVLKTTTTTNQKYILRVKAEEARRSRRKQRVVVVERRGSQTPASLPSSGRT